MRKHRDLQGKFATLTNDDVVNQYLATLGAHLRGPSRARRTVLHEIRGSLAEATEAFTAHGFGEPSAAEAAVADLGAPGTVAAAFAGELAIRQARQVLAALLLTGPLVGIWWLLLLKPAAGASRPGVLATSIPMLPFIAAAVATGMVVIATTGSLIRWIPETAPRRALLAASIVGGVCVAVASAALAMLVARLLTNTAGALPPTIAVLAVAASLIRLPCATGAVIWCLRSAGSLGNNGPESHV